MMKKCNLVRLMGGAHLQSEGLTSNTSVLLAKLQQRKQVLTAVHTHTVYIQ